MLAQPGTIQSILNNWLHINSYFIKSYHGLCVCMVMIISSFPFSRDWNINSFSFLIEEHTSTLSSLSRRGFIFEVWHQSQCHTVCKSLNIHSQSGYLCNYCSKAFMFNWRWCQCVFQVPAFQLLEKNKQRCKRCHRRGVLLDKQRQLHWDFTSLNSMN